MKLISSLTFQESISELLFYVRLTNIELSSFLGTNNKGKCHFCYEDEEKIDRANEASTLFLGLPCCDSCFLEIIDLESEIMDVLVKDGFFADQGRGNSKKQQLL